MMEWGEPKGYSPLASEDEDEAFEWPRTEYEREVDEFLARVYDEGAHNMGGDA